MFLLSVVSVPLENISLIQGSHHCRWTEKYCFTEKHQSCAIGKPIFVYFWTFYNPALHTEYPSFLFSLSRGKYSKGSYFNNFTKCSSSVVDGDFPLRVKHYSVSRKCLYINYPDRDRIPDPISTIVLIMFSRRENLIQASESQTKCILKTWLYRFPQTRALRDYMYARAKVWSFYYEDWDFKSRLTDISVSFLIGR